MIKSSLIIFAVTLSFPAINTYAADEDLAAYLDAVATTSEYNSAKSEVQSAANETSPLVKLRKNKSQQQFESLLSKKYSEEYSTLVTLQESDRLAIYNQYLHGDRMKTIRIAVHQAAANQNH